MSIEENMAIAARRGKARRLTWGITKAERDTYRERCLKHSILDWKTD